ncbi:MAG: GNAT family N-acetyltransferase [Nanoarchaeota archaeon]
MNQVIIRHATKKDLEKCFELCRVPELMTPEINAANYPYPPLIWFKNIFKEKQILIVAEVDSEIVGLRMGERTTGNWVIAHLMVVKKEFRRNGIGQKLVDAFEKECRKRKVGGIMTYVHDNPQTLAFFAKNNYSRGSRVVENIKVLRKF